MFVKKISGVHNRHAKSSILVMSDSLVAQMVVSACNAGNQGSIPGLGRSPGEGNGYPLQYFCLENSIDRKAGRARVHGATKNWARLSN